MLGLYKDDIDCGEALVGIFTDMAAIDVWLLSRPTWCGYSLKRDEYSVLAYDQDNVWKLFSIKNINMNVVWEHNLL